MHCLWTIYKSFVRPHLNYWKCIVQPNNELFCKKTENLQYQTSLTITGAIKGTSRKNFFNNWVLNHLVPEGEFEDYVCYIKYLSLKFLNICITLSH